MCTVNPFDHDNDQFRAKTKRLVGRMTAQPLNRFVFCVVVVEFAVNGNQALWVILKSSSLCIITIDNAQVLSIQF